MITNYQFIKISIFHPIDHLSFYLSRLVVVVDLYLLCIFLKNLQFCLEPRQEELQAQLLYLSKISFILWLNRVLLSFVSFNTH